MTTDLATLQTDAEHLTDQVTSLVVTDEPSFVQAGVMLGLVAGYIARVGDVMTPIVEAAHRAHKVAVGQRDALLQPAQRARRLLGERMATWQAEETHRRRDLEIAAQREQDRQALQARQDAEREQQQLQEAAETQRLAEAVALEAAGDTVGADRLLAEPVPVPVVTPAPIFHPIPPPPAEMPHISGINFRETWSAEVVSFSELVKAVAASLEPVLFLKPGQAGLNLLLPNQPALNELARALKGAMQLPGVRAVSNRTATVRGGDV